MTFADLLADAFGRVHDALVTVVEGLSADQLAYQPGPGSNTIAWLAWHLTRVQDDHIAGAAGTEQVWTSQGWQERFALPLPTLDTGYGHSADQVLAVRASSDLLSAYHEAVFGRTVEFVRSLRQADLDRIVDKRWDPPVSLGVRLVSIIDDDLEHVGQAAYVRGLTERRLP
ncbi:MAG: DinB family protein [Acidimicrobiales bacterium]